MQMHIFCSLLIPITLITQLFTIKLQSFIATCATTNILLGDSFIFNATLFISENIASQRLHRDNKICFLSSTVS